MGTYLYWRTQLAIVSKCDATSEQKKFPHKMAPVHRFCELFIVYYKATHRNYTAAFRKSKIHEGHGINIIILGAWLGLLTSLISGLHHRIICANEQQT